MNKIFDYITSEVAAAFSVCGYDEKYAKVSLSNRPDLCEYQCNGALPAAKEYKKAPLVIAQEIAAKLEESMVFSTVEAVAPGFLNMKLASSFLSHYLNKMYEDDKLGCESAKSPKTIIIDYGGPNVAKPLHVGHLRSAIIGESIKRIGRYMGHNVIGDVHLGDWGLQMGLIIIELEARNKDLVYFDPDYTGEYPVEPPFTISQLEEIYPFASGKSKEDSEYKEKAMDATFQLQNGRRGYQALLQHILNVSVSDLKENYKKLDVSFDLWKGESDAQPYIPEMVTYLKENNYAYMSDGALVVDVKEETDKKEIPPCMILKSDGASLYNTTDLATIVERMKLYEPDEIIYVVDKRQELYFEQVIRCAKKTKLVKEDTKLFFLGFGTMNGKDGKPFKTREGGVMRLESLIQSIQDEMANKIQENRNLEETEAAEISKMVALSAMKYGDLSNQASKDYVFDVERFTSFEGNTGPYILYTIVRIKSILNKYKELGKSVVGNAIREDQSKSERDLMLEIIKFNGVIENSFEELAPHKICSYVYDLANAFNHFYHDTKIISEENEGLQMHWISLLDLTKKILETSIDVLGFKAPERM